MFYIGIDLGTSSLKGILVSKTGGIIKESTKFYDVSYPQDKWSEQNPADWINAMKLALKELSEGIEDEIGGISFGGQMHGLVVLDENDNVIRPCILWNDGRTEKETEYLNNVIGKENLSKYTANIAFAGFTLPKILWMKNNEPENFKKIKKIMLPKDYLAYVLTGNFTTDYSDASGMLLLDVKNKKWSKEMCEIAGISMDMLPELHESYDAIGKVKPEFGLKNCVVAIGGGDNAAAAIGTGTITDGGCNISLGTSGTVFISMDKFFVDNGNKLHAFAHATGKWHLMGCILAAASCNRWWVENIQESEDYSGAVKGMENMVGENNVFFLPYLSGERSPHNDVNARAAFIGMRANTTKEEMSLAVLEGVSFALRDCVEIARNAGVTINKTTLCGGGAKSKLWQQILADILDADVCLLNTEQGPSFGGAILAMVANKEYKDVKEACDSIIKVKEVIHPRKDIVAKYNKKYEIFKQLYPALKDIYKQI